MARNSRVPRLLPRFALGLPLVLLTIGVPEIARAHGTGYRTRSEGTAVSLEFYYSGGDPMAFAEVRVFGPGDTDVEFQNGRTDRSGGFSFHPDRSGEWRVEVHDGRGHAVHAAVRVNEGGTPSLIENSSSRAPVSSEWRDAVLGLSLIANLVLAIRAFRNSPVLSGNPAFPPDEPTETKGTVS